MSTSDKIPVSKFLDQQSEGDRPNGVIAETQQQVAERLKGLTTAGMTGGGEMAPSRNAEFQQAGGGLRTAANLQAQGAGLKEVAGVAILYRVKTCDAKGTIYSEVYVQASDPTAAEQKALAYYKFKGDAHTLYVESIVRLASSVVSHPSHLIL